MSLYDKYFDDLIKLFPSLNDYMRIPKYKNLQVHFENSISEAYTEKMRNFLLKYKKILDKKKNLTIHDKVLKYDIDSSLEGIDYPLNLLPISQMENSVSDYIQSLSGSGSGVYVFKTTRDYEDFMSKNKEFSIWCYQAIINFQLGVLRNVVLPKIIAEKTINDIESLIKGKSYVNKSVPKSLQKKWDVNVKKYVLMPIDALLLYLKKVYLPNTRETLGYSSMENGKEMYEYIVKTQTTNSKLSVKQIHNLGLSEIKRIREEIKLIMKNMNYKGDITSFMKYVKTLKHNKYKNKKELMDDYKRIRARLWKEVIPKYFDVKIGKNYTIKEVPAEIAGSMAAAYYMGPDIMDTRDGIFYLNTRDIGGMLKSGAHVLSKHEGIPGHHFQVSYVNESKGIPMFMKASNYTGYIEGWALYAENLGEYDNDLEYYGKLNSEMLRAVRLVVDTGIHYYNWSYKQCYDVFKKNTVLPDSEIEAEVYRYSAMPGQALAYKIGELTILDLRDKYLKKGGKIKKFHRLVLEDGPLPLDILIEKIKAEIKKLK